MPFQVWFRKHNDRFSKKKIQNQFLLQIIYQVQNSDAVHEHRGLCI